MNKLSPPKPITDLVIREVPGDVLHFTAVSTEIAERLHVEFGAGELGTFGLHDAGTSGYLHYPWPLSCRGLARYMAKVAKCKYRLEFRIEGFPQQEYWKVIGGPHE